MVIVVRSTCSTPQVLADPDASFGLYAQGDGFAQASFDFLGAPVSVPPRGTSEEIELIFAGERDTVDQAAVEAVEFPMSESDAVDVGFDVRYQLVCEPAEDGATGAKGVTTRGGSETTATPSGSTTATTTATPAFGTDPEGPAET
ncbi:hypothetical protein BH23ACT2_BH23ACT2_07040 [soil metagenome]